MLLIKNYLQTREGIIVSFKKLCRLAHEQKYVVESIVIWLNTREDNRFKLVPRKGAVYISSDVDMKTNVKKRNAKGFKSSAAAKKTSLKDINFSSVIE